jgi:hypothetical protein
MKKKKRKRNPYRSPWKDVGLNPAWSLKGHNGAKYEKGQYLRRKTHDDQWKINLHYLPIILLVFLCSCASKQLVLEIVPGEQIEIKDPYQYKIINIIGLKDEQDRTFKMDVKDRYNIKDNGIKRIYEKKLEIKDGAQ